VTITRQLLKKAKLENDVNILIRRLKNNRMSLIAMMNADARITLTERTFPKHVMENQE
jgi:hypothetical protein